MEVKNIHAYILYDLARDLAVCDPRWTPTVEALRKAAEEIERLQSIVDANKNKQQEQ